MNTVYYIVDLDRKAYIEYMDTEIKSNCRQFLELMDSSFNKAPTGEQNVELRKFLQSTIQAYIDKLAYGSCLPGVLSESMALGTSTPTQFYWRRDTGFHSLEDVETYLSAHPSCHIFDHDQNQITLEAFRQILNP